LTPHKLFVESKIIQSELIVVVFDIMETTIMVSNTLGMVDRKHKCLAYLPFDNSSGNFVNVGSGENQAALSKV